MNVDCQDEKDNSEDGQRGRYSKLPALYLIGEVQPDLLDILLCQRE